MKNSCCVVARAVEGTVAEKQTCRRPGIDAQVPKIQMQRAFAEIFAAERALRNRSVLVLS